MKDIQQLHIRVGVRTAGFMKTVSSVYTTLMNTSAIYPTQGFRKQMVKKLFILFQRSPHIIGSIYAVDSHIIIIDLRVQREGKIRFILNIVQGYSLKST